MGIKIKAKRDCPRKPINPQVRARVNSLHKENQFGCSVMTQVMLQENHWVEPTGG
jgi:hypothetical protein